MTHFLEIRTSIHKLYTIHIIHIYYSQKEVKLATSSFQLSHWLKFRMMLSVVLYLEMFCEIRLIATLSYIIARDS